MAVCFISVSLSELLKLIQKCLDKICSVESTVQAYSLNIALVNEDFQTQILGAECINRNVQEKKILFMFSGQVSVFFCCFSLNCVIFYRQLTRLPKRRRREVLKTSTARRHGCSGTLYKPRKLYFLLRNLKLYQISSKYKY